MRIYAYVDGESHYMRSLDAWRKAYGQDAELSEIIYKSNRSLQISAEPAYQFFWDEFYQHLTPSPFNQYPFIRKVYFAALTGTEDSFHEACVAIRQKGFEPHVVRESKDLAERRKNTAADTNMLEKAKGVDIGMSVRLLEDAYHNNFDTCYFFTSDIDFLPVIRVLQRLGKKVVVFGYRSGLGKRSALEYVPDGFVELGEYMTRDYQRIGCTR
jgi:uncharacterized LabA/DUF88 family protein